ncbi:YqcC family protein [Shewanella insulae]|uniref:YqcC family protein n=1 Tax=Shewanella insulae TaxID=2681496 RepID=UPI001EFC9EC6|nr:YqcC family protein [Shewanella insulae]MCG9714466.1 YqcC family protein [Shewanella insulae]
MSNKIEVSVSLYTEKQLRLIEAELKRLQMWQDRPPSPEAMADPTPFACESMAFEQWLQFIFLPKMDEIIGTNGVLPSKIALGPMAEHVWQGRNEMQTLITIINQLDEHLSGSN